MKSRVDLKLLLNCKSFLPGNPFRNAGLTGSMIGLYRLKQKKIGYEN